MKKIILIFLFSSISYILSAQEKAELSAYDKFIVSSKVSVFEKEYKSFFDIGAGTYTGNYLNFRKFKATALSTNDKFEGLYIDARSYSSSVFRSNFAIIDEVEISEFIKFLDLIIPILNQKFSYQKEYVFNTKTFKAALFNTKTNPYSKKMLPKEEEGFNYWIFNIELGNISSVTFEFPDLDKVSELNSKLKSLKFE